MEDLVSKQLYGRFFKSLKQRGHQLDFKTSTDKNVQLSQFGVPNYQNVILLAPSATKIGEGLSHKQFLDFLDNGGNILVGLTQQDSLSIHSNHDIINKNLNKKSNTKVLSDLYYKLAEKSGVTIHSIDSMVLNNFAYGNDNTNGLVYNNDVLVNTNNNNEKVLFNGIGMSIRSDAHLVHSLLTGDKYTYSVLRTKDVTDGAAPDKSILGSYKKLSLVSSLQTRVNSRITFVGSMSMLTDEYLTNKNNDNDKFIDRMTKYTFGESGMIRLSNVEHYKIGDTTINPNRYRIKDEIEFAVTLEEFDSSCDCYVPFTEDDVQFEFIRLDPFIRQRMEHDGNGRYKIRFVIPDMFGVFKFTINYQRRGYSYIDYSELVTIRPMFHSEYERFLGLATPYYAGSWIMVGGFMLFTLIFLFGSKDGKSIW